jgi:hypothetical protein
VDLLLFVLEQDKSKMSSFTTFLSHKYEAAAINKYFFNLLNNDSKIQFEVDEGKLSTNVTRLERMIRDTDAFIGIYPITQSNADTYNFRDLSKYFRLELSIAVRAQKTGIIYVDNRFDSQFKPNNKILKVSYSHNDIVSKAESPNNTIFQEQFTRFTTDLECRLDFDRKYSSTIYQKQSIAVLKSKRYDESFFDFLNALAEKHGKELVIYNSNQSINEKFISQISEIDFFIVDHLEFPSHEGFLHGAFMPMIRACYCEVVNGRAHLNPLVDSFEVGYPKNIICWNDQENFKNLLESQFTTIFSPVRRFATQKQSIDYFEKAERRKEVVFVSYAGENRDEISQFISLLKRRFADVFDYRDKGNSIIPGKPWVKEVFESLSKSSIGIPVYTEDYFKSGNCTHEYIDMVALKDAGDLTILPVKLSQAQLAIPAELQSIQYLRRWEFEDDNELVEKIVSIASSIPKKEKPGS